LSQHIAYVVGDPRHDVAGIALQGQKPADDRLARLGVDDTERQILQLIAHLLHAHAPGEGRIDIHRLARLLQLLFGRQMADRAHVVQPVGQL
jgi:hypothetical protein